jgi:N-acetylmuramoyl-L-alanine amidase
MNIPRASSYRTWVRWARLYSMLLLAALLTACGTPGIKYKLDKSVNTPNQDSRAQFLVLHYTALPLEKSLKVLAGTGTNVSAHYLVPDAPKSTGRFEVYRLAPEERRTWHAGVSFWYGTRLLNSASLGIETVNLGYPESDHGLPLMQRRWYPFPAAQVEVIAQLIQDIIKRHHIKPVNVVGHSDVAPGRKVDPGPLFPWHELFVRYQIGAWPDAGRVEFYKHTFPFILPFNASLMPTAQITALQKKLQRYGYDTPQTGVLDEKTSAVIAAFQMHFRPALYDGAPDIETVAILDALLEKYRH